MVVENGAIANTEVQTFIGLGESREGDVYRFSFTAKSNNRDEIVLNTNLIRNSAPFNPATSHVTRIIPRDFENYTFYAETLSSEPGVNYWLTANSDYLPLVLDNISAKVVQGSFKEYADLVLVKTNSTNSNQTFRLESDYFDVNGNLNIAGSELTIEPNRTLVLFPK